MRKLLSILGAVVLTTTAASAVTACSNKATKKMAQSFGEAWLNDPSSIFVKLNGEMINRQYVSPKKVTVEGYKVREAYIAMNTLEIYLTKEVELPETGVSNIAITYKNKSGKTLKTTLELSGNGNPGEKVPTCDNVGTPNEDLNVFTFKTSNILDNDNIKINFKNDLPKGVTLESAFVKDNVLTLKFNGKFVKAATDEIYNFSFEIGQIIISSRIDIRADDTLPSLTSVVYKDGNNQAPNYIYIKGTNLDKLPNLSLGWKISPNDLSWMVIGVNTPDDDDDYDGSYDLRMMVGHDNPLPESPETLTLTYDNGGIHVEGTFQVKE